VLVYDGATMRTYVNGVASIATAPSTLALEDNTSPVRVGTDGSVSWFEGGMDELAVYPRALSANRVLAHYQAGLP
jgi:hypothetical protein